MHDGREMKFNDDHQLETLHACHMVQTMFDEFVLESVFVDSDDELKKEAQAASDLIMKLYQTIGRIED